MWASSFAIFVQKTKKTFLNRLTDNCKLGSASQFSHAHRLWPQQRGVHCKEQRARPISTAGLAVWGNQRQTDRAADPSLTWPKQRHHSRCLVLWKEAVLLAATPSRTTDTRESCHRRVTPWNVTKERIEVDYTENCNSMKFSSSYIMAEMWTISVLSISFRAKIPKGRVHKLLCWKENGEPIQEFERQQSARQLTNREPLHSANSVDKKE